jgi:hypothetical protein
MAGHGGPQGNHDSAQCLTALLREIGNVEQAVELIYMSRDPSILQVLRQFAALPAPQQREFKEFLSRMAAPLAA